MYSSMWRVRRERAPIAVNRLDCAAYELLWSVDLRSYLSFVVTSMPVSTSPLDEAGTATHFPLSETSGRKGLTSSRAPTIQSRQGHQLWRVKGERAPIAVNRLDCTACVSRRELLIGCRLLPVLGTANLNSIPQPQIPQNSNGWSATANPQVCGTFAVISCTSATANDFSLPQTWTANFAAFFSWFDKWRRRIAM